MDSKGKKIAIAGGIIGVVAIGGVAFYLYRKNHQTISNQPIQSNLSSGVPNQSNGVYSSSNPIVATAKAVTDAIQTALVQGAPKLKVAQGSSYNTSNDKETGCLGYRTDLPDNPISEKDEYVFNRQQALFNSFNKGEFSGDLQSVLNEFVQYKDGGTLAAGNTDTVPQCVNDVKDIYTVIPISSAFSACVMDYWVKRYTTNAIVDSPNPILTNINVAIPLANTDVAVAISNMLSAMNLWYSQLPDAPGLINTLQSQFQSLTQGYDVTNLSAYPTWIANLNSFAGLVAASLYMKMEYSYGWALGSVGGGAYNSDKSINLNALPNQMPISSYLKDENNQPMALHVKFFVSNLINNTNNYSYIGLSNGLIEIADPSYYTHGNYQSTQKPSKAFESLYAQSQNINSKNGTSYYFGMPTYYFYSSNKLMIAPLGVGNSKVNASGFGAFLGNGFYMANYVYSITCPTIINSGTPAPVSPCGGGASAGQTVFSDINCNQSQIVYNQYLYWYAQFFTGIQKTANDAAELAKKILNLWLDYKATFPSVLTKGSISSTSMIAASEQKFGATNSKLLTTQPQALGNRLNSQMGI